MRGCWAQHHLVAGGAAPRIFGGWNTPRIPPAGRGKGIKKREGGMGKAPNSSAAERRRKEPEGAPPVRTQPQKLPQFHGKLGKKDFPVLLASPTKPFLLPTPRIFPAVPVCSSFALWSSFGHSKCCLQPGLETILGFGQGSEAGAPWARLGRNLAEHQEFGPRRSRQGST